MARRASRRVCRRYRQFRAALVEAVVGYAKDYFELGAEDDDDGTTVREALLAEWRNGGVEPARLAQVVELPLAGRYLWDYWKELHKRRARGWDASPLSWPEIEAWLRVTNSLTGRTVEAWEVAAVLEIDDELTAALEDERKRRAERDKAKGR